MNYSGNMPDWHQYNSVQLIGSEVPHVGQNVNHSPIFGPSISPRRLNGSTFSPEGLNKPINDTNFNPRSFQQSPNTLNGPNVPPENPPMGSAAQIPGCHGPYGTPSPRNTMIEGTNASLDSRNTSGGSLNEAMGQRNHQISMNRPATHLNCSAINAPMGPVGQRNTAPNLQGPIPMSSRQGSGSYMTCKLPCCNPDTNIGYQSWEKFGPYTSNMPYRDSGYPLDNRRFGNDFDNREQLGTGPYNVDPRRNFSDYKYRKDSIIPRTYAHPSGVIQNYHVQNYNLPPDFQKYPSYPIKEYSRDSSITNPQNPAILKYQEQSVIVQQKYFTKQIQYQNGVIPKSVVPTNIEGNIISRTQNPYFNPQLARDFPRNYSDGTHGPNRGIQTGSSIHTTYPKYQMYQQKIAMQRYSMENHLRELTRIPGYQSHPKYQESVLRYQELLRLQQTVDYQSTVQDTPKVVTSQVNDEIPPINLQFDQNGHLINSSFTPAGSSNLQSSINLQNSRNVQSLGNTKVGLINLQHSEHFKTQVSVDNHVQNQESSLMSQTELSHKSEQQYSIEKDQLHVQKYESISLNIQNSDDGKSPAADHRNSRDFADKPELDVRQFLANWDESEDEDGPNANLPDVVLSNSTSGVVEYENTTAVQGNLEEPENCSGAEECRSRDDCGMFENTQNERELSNSTDAQIYKCDLPLHGDTTKSIELGSDTSDSEKKPVRIGTVIQPASTECEHIMTSQITEDLANIQTVPNSIKLSHHETESLNNNESQEAIDTVKGDIIIKKESLIEEETITSIEEHITVYNHETDTEICSSIQGIIQNNEDSKSNSEKESSEKTNHHFVSNEDLSASGDSNSMESCSISSFIQSPETINGTEIHVDTQELSAIPVPPKSNSDQSDGTNLQKQNSFASEESHNPDDISLPDLPTSECTPISTTLNTPIHSDSEESLEPVIDLTTPANPIEIIQNSPMLSFTHSPIKMEPYEHLDENDLTDKVSHDALDFEFQASNSCDNDYEKLTDVNSHATELYNIVQNHEDTCDSDCIEILPKKTDQKITGNTYKVQITNDIMGDITEQNQFAFNNEHLMTTKMAHTAVNADHQPWPSAIVRKFKHQASNNTEHQDTKSDINRLEILSKMKDRSSPISEITADCSKDDIVNTLTVKNYHGINRLGTKCELQDVKFKSTENMTALNLVKDQNKMKSNSVKMIDEIANSEIVAKTSRSCSSNLNMEIDFKHLNQRECNTSMEKEVIFTPTGHTGRYVSTSEEDKIYSESIENPSNFAGSLNIPLIPGEDFEEPKMPVLPMEGNCLTKIIKNTSPITDLDVLGSDDEKLNKMDEIWMEVGGVETVDKGTDVNMDTYIDCGDGAQQEKSLSSTIKLHTFQKNDWKCFKNSVKVKDPNKFTGKTNNKYQEQDLKNATGNISQEHDGFCSLETVQMKLIKQIDEDFQRTIIRGTVNTAAKTQEKHNFIKVPIIPRITNNSSTREDGEQSHNMCFEINATEISKCQEKANHINDIATKLLENARLFEPELKKKEVQRKESSCGKNNGGGSEKRVKLLKEFRKVKSKVNIDRPGIQPAGAVNVVGKNSISLIEITEECKKVESKVMKVNNKMMNNQNAFTGTIQNVLLKSDSLIMNSLNTFDCQIMQKMNLNTQNNGLHVISTDIVMPVEKPKQIQNEGEATSKNEDTTKGSYGNVNIEDSITVEDGNSVNSHSSPETKPASSIEEDINERAINLSKSSNDSISQLSESSVNGYKSSDSHKSNIFEVTNFAKPTEIESKINKDTICTESKDYSPIELQFSCPKDSGLCSEIVENVDKILEINYIGFRNVTKDYRGCDSASKFQNSPKKHISEEHTKQKVDQDSMGTADREESEECLGNLEKGKELAKSCRLSENIVEGLYKNCKEIINVSEIDDVEKDTILSKEAEHSVLNELVAVTDDEDQKPANKTVNFEITSNAEIVWNNVGSSIVNKEESTIMMNHVDDLQETPSSNHSQEDETFIKSYEKSLENISKASEEKVFDSMGSCIETSVSHQEGNVDKVSASQQLLEFEPKVNHDYLTNVKIALQDSALTTSVHAESETMLHDLKLIEEPLIVNESLEQTQSEKYTRPKCLRNTNLELVSETDKSSNTVDMTPETFGLENSFNCDFSNFDVAPNFCDIANTDESNNWKYSKAYARFEDCERYKNPDNFVNPILTSLETLYNLNTVPVYTTKDGKITYSPNPKFTYRALIMEAREREGYPVLRQSYSGNPRAPESSHYSKSQASLRKRKNSNTNSYTGSYSKKNYSEFYESKEHGESSLKHVPELWNRSFYSYNKYNHQPRDRNSYHFTSHNSDMDRKYINDKIAQEKGSSKYKQHEGCNAIDEHNKPRNGNLDSFKCNDKKQHKQLTDQSTLNSVWSGSKRNLKCDRNLSEDALSKSEINKMTHNKKIAYMETTTRTGKHMNTAKYSSQLRNFQQREKFISTSDETKYVAKSNINTSTTETEMSMSSDALLITKKIPNSGVEKVKSPPLRADDRPSNDHNTLEIPIHEAESSAIVRSGLFSSEWEDSCENLTVHQMTSCRISTENLLDEIKEICNRRARVNELCEEVDDVCLNKTANINEKESNNINSPNNRCMTPSNSVKSMITNYSFMDPDCNKNNHSLIDRDVSIVNNTGNTDICYSISVEVVQTDKDVDKQKILEVVEIANESKALTSLNEEVICTQKKDNTVESLHCIDCQMNLNCIESYTSQVKDVDHQDLVKDEIHMDEQTKFASLNQISEVQNNFLALESKDQILHNSENLCSLLETEEMETKESKMKIYKIQTETRHETLIENSPLLKMISQPGNSSKTQCQFENYVTYAPSNQSLEDMKAIPKLVIKKTDSLNCRNLCLGPPLAMSHNAFTEKVSDKEERGSKASTHPKIPKILIRNAKSRPSTPSIEEVTEMETPTVTIKEDSKVPKVKIRFEEKKPRSSSVSSNGNISKTEGMEAKIPKMKIKLEDRLPKVIIKNVNTEYCTSNDEVQKTIPKIKIKKFQGTLRQVIDTQILPISIPRMFTYTEPASKEEIPPHIVTKTEIDTSDKNLKCITSNSSQGDQKTVKDADLKRIPKLKIKRQSSGCSIELNRKRSNMSPIQSEVKKFRKSSKLGEPNDKKQFNKLSMAAEHQDSLRNLDTFRAKDEEIQYTGGSISRTPEELPKVIIKRASPSAEFKCELSKVRRDAIIKNKRWQPEVKLQRSWVLDCMAKDLNLDQLRLKLATPDSVSKKSLPQKQPGFGEMHMKNNNVNTIQSKKKLFRSKSTSELLPSHGTIGILAKDDIKQLNERNTTHLPRELITSKRCNSDLGSTFSKSSEDFEHRKKLRYDNYSNIIQLMSKTTFNYANEFVKSSIQSVKEPDIDIEKYRETKNLKTNFNLKEIQSNTEAVNLMKISERNQDETLGENIKVKDEISTPGINSLALNNEAAALNLNSKMLSATTDTINSSVSTREYFKNDKEITDAFVNDLKINGTEKVKDSQLHYPGTDHRDRFEGPKNSVIVMNTSVDAVKRHTNSTKSYTKEMKNQNTKKDETLELENNSTLPIKNVSTNYIRVPRTREGSSTSIRDGIHQAKTVTDDVKSFAKSSMPQTPILTQPDINIVQNNLEISSFDASNTMDNHKTMSCKNDVYELDINDNSADTVEKKNDDNVVNENSTSHHNKAEQDNTCILNRNLLMTSAINNSKLTDSEFKDIQAPKMSINPNDSSDYTVDNNSNSITEIESSKESQTIMEKLSALPNVNESQVQIQSCPDVIEENGICLYHEDAIPTQFELELEIIDNTEPDPLEVPMPRIDHFVVESQFHSGDELNESSHELNENRTNPSVTLHLDDSKSETTLGKENSSQVGFVGTYQREVFTYPDKQDTILSVDISKQNSLSNSLVTANIEFDTNVEKSFSCSELLVKEVLAAKETLRKCLVKSKNESRFKTKARPKTAAEKKQGSSFDLSMLSTCEDSFTKLENHSPITVIAEGNSSKHIDPNFSSANNNNKIVQNQTKNECKVNRVKAERKHSKGNENNFMLKKYSSLPTYIQKYPNHAQVEGHLISKYSSKNINDIVELPLGETTISLKNSKHLVRNYLYSDVRKKMPELVNSKDSRYRSKSSKRGWNSKYVEKSKSILSNTAVQESKLDSNPPEEKSVYDAAKHKYKSIKTSMNQKVNSMTDKGKYKLYKISKPTNPKNNRLSEKLQESHSTETRMPILEPEVHLNGSLEDSELFSDRETSRSPPVITNQENRANYEISIPSLEYQGSLNEENEVQSRQRTTILEKKVPECIPSYDKETTVADIVNDMAYHEKATIRHRRYCTLCERWFPTVARYKRHLSGYQHRHTELTQRRTIHALFTLFTGRPCPMLQPPSVVRIDCEPGELTPLQIAVQGVTKESNKVDGNIKKPIREDK